MVSQATRFSTQEMVNCVSTGVGIGRLVGFRFCNKIVSGIHCTPLMLKHGDEPIFRGIHCFCVCPDVETWTLKNRGKKETIKNRFLGRKGSFFLGGGELFSFRE